MNDTTGTHRPDLSALAERYRDFAVHQAATSSPTLRRWAEAVAADPVLIAPLASLPPGKQQPNLVFAAARWHGARPGDVDSLRELFATRWDAFAATVRSRATQTNEPARCAAILLGLRQLRGQVALLEIGASAGLCLIPDRYSYSFNSEARLEPPSGNGPVALDISLGHGLLPPAVMPHIVWRAGLDLHPLDPADPDTLAWLHTLVWPEHEARRARLTAAATLVTEEGVRVTAGDLTTDLTRVAADAPRDATLVVTHSATLAYLDEPARRTAVEHIGRLGAHRISFEARGVDPSVPRIDTPATPDTLFVAALDGVPYALGDGHGTVLTRP
ncbi:DUF2332 domain-containing protein [Streptomyces sp. BSE7-9]|uniref:DUF2332 domain-containing protein n=1 Tax=Streptomyces sp. BSE7-9 TaxID=2759948 RepID=UPI0018EE7435|nr:DUF2332 domain-containing protein [Streptomyces sp. BSE7-9]MBJ6643072.1 DUF2332 domain-containing protein [Streptomyces sp. BSE7-9]